MTLLFWNVFVYNKNMKKFYLLVCCCVCCVGLQAQIPAKAARQSVKMAGKRAVVPERMLPSYGGAHRAVMGVDYHLVSSATQTMLETSVQRSWWEQQKRDLKAWQLKRAHQKQVLQNLKLQQEIQQLEQMRALLPRLQPEKAFEVTEFSDLIAQQLPAQPLPFLAEPGILYRGMALSGDGASVAHILQNGLLVEDAGVEANTLNMAFSGGQRGSVQALAARPVTNLTSFPQDAAVWGSKRLTPGKELLVIVRVNGQERSGNVVTIDQDIPAGNITHLIAPLTLSGQPAWCEISLTPNGTFLVIPYQNEAVAP